MIRALIADDEAASAELLRELLEDTGRVSVVGVAHDGPECLRLLEQLEPDVLFLDIRMPGMEGVEVAEAALDAEILPLLVFVTDYDEYAVRAFELAAIDYIVKPLEVEAFEQRIDQTVTRLEETLSRRAPTLRALQRSINGLARQQGQFVLRRLPVKDYEEGTVRLIPPSAVTHVERVGGQTVLHTKGKSFRTYYTIDRLEERLQSAGFFRASRGALLNMQYIEHLIPNGDGSYDAIVEAEGNPVVTVSRSRAQSLLRALGS